MASLSKTFVVVFVFLGTFSLLVSFIPAEFYSYQEDKTYSPTLQDKEATAFFSANNVTVYNTTLSLNNDTYPFLHYGESQSFDFGLPEGHKIEFWWDVEISQPAFEIRHTSPGPFGWWTEYHRLAVMEPYRSLVGHMGWLRKSDLEVLWNNKGGNASYCEFECDHISVKIFISPANSSWTIGESWDNQYLQVFTSYDIHWQQTGVGMFTVLTHLLLFQSPNLGMSGVGGTILTTIIALFLWACIAIIMFAIITALIPFISGWGD